MSKKKFNSSSFYYPFSHEFWWSKAVQELTRKELNLLYCFIGEFRYDKYLKKWSRNGQISFTEYEWVEKKLGSKNTYLKGRNKLIKVGILKIEYRGGWHKGDMNRYKLLVPSRDVLIEEQRWRRYPHENWEDEIPQEKKSQVGKKSRFKKSQNTPLKKVV